MGYIKRGSGIGCWNINRHYKARFYRWCGDATRMWFSPSIHLATIFFQWNRLPHGIAANESVTRKGVCTICEGQLKRISDSLPLSRWWREDDEMAVGRLRHQLQQRHQIIKWSIRWSSPPRGSRKKYRNRFSRRQETDHVYPSVVNHGIWLISFGRAKKYQILANGLLATKRKRERGEKR